ncbi:MAG: AsmA family protein [Acidobacteriia bacterium]|nr:AsmA family protein [Terriglobia bacterium]
MRAGLVVGVLLLADLSAVVVLQSRPVKRMLTARLETAFGRRVEVGRFGLSLLPTPRLEADGVTVGEDPAFGYEYFLRAERVTAGLRWGGLLRGRFEFGAFSFTRPSLTLVRDSAGGWNIDRWLPPARSAAGGISGEQPTAPSVRLDLVEFDDGRVNFKSGEDKLAFAFTGVSGKVAQIAPGRWTLRLKAQPWRSGTPLQDAGTILVRGDIAGTSARLQPAELFIHWGNASLADLLRLVRGQDYGLRGEVTVDAVARSGGVQSPGPVAASGEWGIHVEARAREIHRWDLSERRDNPAVNVLLDGRWNIVSNQVRVAPLTLEFPQSSARGQASFSLYGSPDFELRLDSLGLQAADVLSWYRAFQPDVAEGVSAEGYLTGAAAVRGWPLAVENMGFSSNGFTLRAPDLGPALRVGPFEGGLRRKRLTLDPMWCRWIIEEKADSRAKGKAAPRPAAGEKPANSVQLTATHDLERGTGAFTAEGHMERAEEFLALTAALGRPIERGWTGKGGAAGALRWEWQGGPWNSMLSGHLDFTRGELQVAGLNLPLAVNDAQLLWSAGKRAVRLRSIEALGANWSGELEEDSRLFAGKARAGKLTGGEGPADASAAGWKFRLHADHLLAADLDLWTGPRARPGWLERLLPGLLGKAAPAGEAGAGSGATELLRRIRAEGEIRVDELTVEKQKLTGVQARAALVDLRLALSDASAGYAGGRVRGGAQASFLPRPRYVFDLQLDGVRLGDLLAAGKPVRAAQDFPEGIAAGPIHLETEGVGREELLRNLEGRGRVSLRNVSLRGWDGGAAGLPPADRLLLSTRWPAGEAQFTLGQGAIEIGELRLQAGRQKIGINGRVDFSRSANLSLGVPPAKGPGLRKLLRIAGPLEAPRLSAAPQAE